MSEVSGSPDFRNSPYELRYRRYDLKIAWPILLKPVREKIRRTLCAGYVRKAYSVREKRTDTGFLNFYQYRFCLFCTGEKISSVAIAQNSDQAATVF